MSQSYQIPKRIRSYLKRLELSYLHDNDNRMLEVVRNASVKVDEDTDTNRWGNESSGHTVSLFLSADYIRKIGNIKTQSAVAERLKTDLNECSQGVPNEYIHGVNIELFDDLNPECKLAISPLGIPEVSPEGLGIWKHGYIRVFISHKAEYKIQISQLAEALSEYGISCFVAHEAIEPLEEWEDQIRKALFSMEVLLVFLTDDFQNSRWTDQEIGVAIGRGIPIIPLKMQNKDPHGFIGKYQAIRGDMDNVAGTTTLVRKTIREKIDREGRLKTAAIEAFANTRDWGAAKQNFEALKEYGKFNDDEINRIVGAFNFNNQLYGAAYLANQYDRFMNFLKGISNRDFHWVDGKVVEKKDALDDSIPF